MFEKIAQLKKEGIRIGLTASTFDLLHAGHIAMLEEAKSQCDFLIVGLLTDPTNDRKDSKNAPVQTTYERWIQAQAIKVIDMLIPFDTEEDLISMIKMIKPHVRIVGEEYKGTHHTGWDIKDVEIYYNTRNHNYGSTQLRKKILEQEQKHDKTRCN